MENYQQDKLKNDVHSKFENWLYIEFDQKSQITAPREQICHQ